MMGDFLRKAFVSAHSGIMFLQDQYDLIGLSAARALMDTDFLKVDTSGISNENLRKAADAYHDLKGVAQGKLFTMASQKFASGDMGTKPSMKTVAMKLGQTLLPLVPKIHMGQMATITLCAAVALTALHLGSNSNPGALGTDILSTIMGGKTGRNGASPIPHAVN